MHMGYTNNVAYYDSGVVMGESKNPTNTVYPKSQSRHHWKFYGATAVNGSAKIPKGYFLDLINIIIIIIVVSSWAASCT